MQPLIFHGNSDDTFGEYGRTNEDHDNCASGKPIRFRVAAADGALFVVGQYSPGNSGAWLVGVEPVDEEEAPMPAWPMRMRRPATEPRECPYSPTLEIDAPADATVTHVPKHA